MTKLHDLTKFSEHARMFIFTILNAVINTVLLPDCMFIRKMLQSDWLDSGTWTICTFPYRRSGPFIRLSIKVKRRDFWEDGRETIDRGREMLVTFRKLSVNFENFPGRPETVDYYIFSRVFHQFISSAQTFPSMFNSEYFSQAINSLITGWTVYTKNINPSVLRIDLPAVGLYVRTSGFIFFRIDSPISY